MKLPEARRNLAGEVVGGEVEVAEEWEVVGERGGDFAGDEIL